LAQFAKVQGVKVDCVRKVIVAGEPGGSIPAVRQRISDVWNGARVFDHHGMTETGPVTYECPARPGTLHVREAAYLAEIVDPATGKPRRHGEVGELVLTTLGRLGSPLLRYKTGDLVKAASASTACACGRHELALEGGILGRTDDMVVVRGVNVYPSAVEELVRSTTDIAEYRVQISSSGALTEMSLQIEPGPQCQDAAKLVARLEAAFEAAMALRVPITVVAAGALPRFEMKGKRWVRT
jgi:phenylacetate-CoA ligase